MMYGATTTILLPAPLTLTSQNFGIRLSRYRPTRSILLRSIESAISSWDRTGSAECGVGNAECGMRSGECGVGSAEWGMRSGEWGVRNAKTVNLLLTIA